MGDRQLSAEMDAGPVPGETTAWEVSQTLLEAHSRSGEALEQCLLLHELEGNVGDEDAMERAIEQAISDHERIIEDLEAALETVSN